MAELIPDWLHPLWSDIGFGICDQCKGEWDLRVIEGHSQKLCRLCYNRLCGIMTGDYDLILEDMMTEYWKNGIND